MGNVTTCLTYARTAQGEERSSPPFDVADLLDDLKTALARPDQGTWISLSMVLTSTGGLTVDYNYDREVPLGLGVTASDFSLELQRSARSDDAVPAWWRERILQGDD